MQRSGPSPESFPPLPKSCYTARPKSTRRSLSLSGNLSMEGQEVAVASGPSAGTSPAPAPPAISSGVGEAFVFRVFSTAHLWGRLQLSPGTTSCSVSRCGCDQGTNPSELVVPDRQQRGNQRPEKGFFKRGKRRAALIPPKQEESFKNKTWARFLSLSLSCSTLSAMLNQILLET